MTANNSFNLQAAKLLAIDDEPFVTEIIQRWLNKEGYSCDTASSAAEGLNLLASQHYELVISDIMMPGMDGIELLGRIKAGFPEVAVIMATAVDDRETAIRTLQLGAYGYMIKPFEHHAMVINVANALERRRLVLESLEYERRLEQEVLARTEDIRRREEEITLHLLSAADYRDEETGAHVRRLGLYAMVLARELGWHHGPVEYIRVAAPMHDVGKIGIPDAVLRKPGKLTAEEFAIIKTHPEIGARILGGSDIPLLQMATDIAMFHHEKWDGSGYPRGLQGEAIPEAARIVAVADVYDALVNARIYRPALPEQEALAIMDKGRGSHFDPKIYDAFLRALPLFREILAKHADVVEPVSR